MQATPLGMGRHEGLVCEGRDVYRVPVTHGNQLRVTIEREETDENGPALPLLRATAQVLEQ